MANSATELHERSTENKLVSAVRRTGQSFWFRFWGVVRGRIWQMGVASVVVAGALAFVYWRLLAPVDVRSHEVRSGEIVAEVMGTGTVATHVKVTISANITGLLSEVLFDQGDQVESGQVIARLDDRDLIRQVKVEEANVSARKATVERLIADKNSAQSNLERASHDFERAQRLPNRALSRQDYDRYLDAFNTAKAGMERAEAALVEGQKLLIATFPIRREKRGGSLIRSLASTCSGCGRQSNRSAISRSRVQPIRSIPNGRRTSNTATVS